MRMHSRAEARPTRQARPAARLKPGPPVVQALSKATGKYFPSSVAVDGTFHQGSSTVASTARKSIALPVFSSPWRSVPTTSSTGAFARTP
jgi:hypothetical protein